MQNYIGKEFLNLKLIYETYKNGYIKTRFNYFKKPGFYRKKYYNKLGKLIKYDVYKNDKFMGTYR